MSSAESVRNEVHRLQQRRPFRPFALMIENGDRIIIEHPENIAFDTSIEEGTPGWDEFYVLAKRLRVFSTFGKVSSVALADTVELVH